jgi:UDP-N-acetyl-D-mannosaminuronate dehydrogenase
MKPRLEIAILGGAGHIGAPLGIVLANRETDVVLYDRNKSALESIAEGRLPFLEKNGDKELCAALRTGRLWVSADIAALCLVDAQFSQSELPSTNTATQLEPAQRVCRRSRTAPKGGDRPPLDRFAENDRVH